MSPSITEEFSLRTNGAGQWVLSRPGLDDVIDVRVRRAFPLGEPEAMVSIRDGEGQELLFIDRLTDLPAEVAAAVRLAVKSATFVPTITSVDRVEMKFGIQMWDVQTDRGPIQFRVQEREDLRFLPGGDFRIKDVDGNVYSLTSLAALDDASRKAVERLL